MTVHSLYVFDKKGKTLFAKNYSAISQQIPASVDDDEEYLAEKRKLIFGMLFSLRELTGSLGPEGLLPGKCCKWISALNECCRYHISIALWILFTLFGSQLYTPSGQGHQLSITTRQEVGFDLLCTRIMISHKLSERVRILSIRLFVRLCSLSILIFGLNALCDRHYTVANWLHQGNLTIL